MQIKKKAIYVSPKFKKKEIKLNLFFQNRFSDSFDSLLGTQVYAQSAGCCGACVGDACTNINC